MGQIVNVSESERKYKLDFFQKDSLWDREFIIYQWYDFVEKEKKTKLIIDLLNLTAKWVRVTKCRLNNSDSKKKIEYLSSDDIDLSKLVGSAFVCKRRSLKGKISIDTFYRSNNICKYLVENEDNPSILESIPEFQDLVLRDVTEDTRFRNTNMTTTFTEVDKNNLLFLVQLLKK